MSRTHQTPAWRSAILLAALAILATGQAQASVIFNVDFEGGNNGSTDYTFFPVPVTQPTSLMMAEGFYSIVTNPRDVHQLWTFGPTADHTFGTPGTGHMMVVNGIDDPLSASSNRVWFKDGVTLNAGTTYVFSAWADSVYPNSPAKLQIMFDDGSGLTPLGSLDLAGDTPGIWENFTATFTSNGGSGKLVAIFDTVDVALGNDFALDDISLEAVPEPASLAIWGLGGLCAAAGAALRSRKRRIDARNRWSETSRSQILSIVSGN